MAFHERQAMLMLLSLGTIQDDTKKNFEPGKLADLAVLWRDIFTVAAGQLSKTESVLTMINGKRDCTERARFE
jgi:predicted amidohydrolase YtcJ